jgi:hypothetical protein
MGFRDHAPEASWAKNGNQLRRYPIRKMRKVRFRIFISTDEWPSPAHLGMVKAMALPTAKRKEGKTRSVGVNPSQAACRSGANAGPAWLLTMIMKNTVIPLKTSRAVKRCADILRLFWWY